MILFVTSLICMSCVLFRPNIFFIPTIEVFALVKRGLMLMLEYEVPLLLPQGIFHLLSSKNYLLGLLPCRVSFGF